MKAVDASSQDRSALATARSAPSQTRSRNASAPTPAAMAAYWIARATAKTTCVGLPVFWPLSSCATVLPGAALPAPTENTKPPETMCPSADTTR